MKLYFYFICFSDEDHKELLCDLAIALQGACQFEEAAIIYQTYLQQPLDAVKTLCLGHLWPEAQRIASTFQLSQSLGILHFW